MLSLMSHAIAMGRPRPQPQRPRATADLRPQCRCSGRPARQQPRPPARKPASAAVVVGGFRAGARACVEAAMATGAAALAESARAALAAHGVGAPAGPQPPARAPELWQELRGRAEASVETLSIENRFYRGHMYIYIYIHINNTKQHMIISPHNNKPPPPPPYNDLRWGVRL